MNTTQEEFEANALTPAQLAEQIQAQYVIGMEKISCSARESYTKPGAQIWGDFVRESYLTVHEPDSVSWDAYADAKFLMNSKKFLFSIKEFAALDDNGNGLVDMQEARRHLGDKKVEHLMRKDQNFDENISLAEFMKTVINPLEKVLDEYKFRYNNFLDYHDIRI